MPKSTQTRFSRIRDNHNHCTSLRLLFLIIITEPYWCQLIQGMLSLEYSWLACSIVGEIHILPVSHDYLWFPKASVGMYSGCDYLLSLKNLVCVLYGIAIPTSTFNFILYLFLFFFIAWVQLLYSEHRWSSRVRVKVVAMLLVNSHRR